MKVLIYGAGVIGMLIGVSWRMLDTRPRLWRVVSASGAGAVPRVKRLSICPNVFGLIYLIGMS